ncbi:S1C family serine protease [Kitasatospora sp. NBC_01266]|uniref:S1C family serine protease n=1 Tax=Kitasatospora sp. NBC_01266 TaxID=2903572 RepID=UPI002E320E13|nr:trypsin-like peptidase domain-containing protein [Kitasatospora sp. NBC_01266]
MSADQGPAEPAGPGGTDHGGQQNHDSQGGVPPEARHGDHRTPHWSWGPPPQPGTAIPGAPPVQPPASGYPYGPVPPPPPYPPGPMPPAYYGYPPVRRRPLRTSLVLAAVLALAVGAGIGLDQAFWQNSSSAGPAPSNPMAPYVPPGSGGGTGTTGASGVAGKVDPTLVNINVTIGYQGAQAAGTGIVLSSNGEILTNNHVIDGATAISATDVGNGRTYTATVVGYDRTGDLAVIQLKDASGLATAKLGDSSKVSVGDTVTAIGNAGGTDQTPTAAAGSVTGLDQAITASDQASGTSEQLTGMIQVDANVQPGDSGGSLVNSSGAVIGIDTAGSDGSGQQQAGTQGFAIPIDTAVPLAAQMMAGKASTDVHIGPTAFLGVEVATDSGSGSGNGGSSGGGSGGGGSGNGDSGNGVPIAGAVPGSPAAQAGLGQGDEITAVDGHTVLDPDALTGLMASQTPGNQVTVQWTDAGGASHSSTVTLVSGPAD